MSELQWNGDAIANKINTAAQRGVRLAGEHLRTVAVSRAPVETGHLRASAAVEAGEGKAVQVWFRTRYAMKQHEELGYRHKDGQAKYLESAMTSERAKLRAIIAQQIKGGL
ncbi:hypothetical protein [Corynebacterium sp.]|uniref:hypothetical protein n=1 Tax=Corynebacterium sp. TaxID=1720 RepID=UPI0028A9013B|nr:hypothetical protein [Corynebacterium sp.]